MSEKLTELRNKIDAIDLKLLELLRARADVIEEVRAVKGPQAVYIRPGREASMLRTLLAQPMGHIPKGLVHRLWREMIGAFTLQEGAMRVAVADVKGNEGLWDLVRDHFGAFTPLQSFSSSLSALRAVLAKTHQLAVLPFPQGDVKEVWWRLLLGAGADAPKVFYRIPFDGQKGNARPVEGDGVLVGLLKPEATSADRSVLVLEWNDVPERGTLQKLLATLPVPHGLHVLGQEGREPACSWLELDGFFTADHPALKSWLGQHKDLILRHALIGAYPVPLS